MSSDFEDIVYILNNRSKIWDELSGAPKDVRTFIRKAFARMIENDVIYEWISAHLQPQEQKRVNLIVGGLREVLEIDT